jgi:succinate dehydrogenase / fumarate reductase iron-sulfur subunit
MTVTESPASPLADKAKELVRVHLRIKRYDPETDTRPRWQEFEVEMSPGDRVLDALHLVKWT